AASLVGYGLTLVFVVVTQLPLALAVAFCFLAACCFGMRATSNAAIMTEQVTDARTTLLALSAATVSAGTVVAGAGGGAAVDAGGFVLLGLFSASAAGLSALLVSALVRERHAADGATAAETLVAS